ncbi:MAG: molybdopterin oxidoreductase membrane subunit [Dehalococcoidia bacterium]|nr:MAG: molybdopterin oxidoreductase membrane subunit [Dehalococcoidia bacterium]
MQERVPLTDRQVNEELLRSVFVTPLRFWVSAAILAFIASFMVTAFVFMVIFGLGLTGLDRPVFWGFMITNFVFWVGISHAGTMISSILRLTQAEWKRPVTRAAETMTVFSLATAALFPLIHTGRPWRIVYWVFPYDFNHQIFPNPRSPLVWDPSAIFTYLTGSALFVLIALIPDFALIRDRSTGLRRTIYGALALGWRGTPRQWKMQTIVGVLLSALILPVFVSVHSIVSWDFAVSLVPAWHATVFAPYFVIGAVHSGVSAVVTLMAIMRKFFDWKNHLRPEHFDAIGRLLIAVGCAWLYFFMLDVFYAIYAAEPAELAVMELRFLSWPWGWLFWLIVITAFIVPIPLWLKRSNRRNITLMFWTSVLVNIGMWSERFWLIVPGLQHKEEFVYMWNTYMPNLVEIALVSGSVALVGLFLLLFSKVCPPIPLWEIKEGQKFTAEIPLGRMRVPAIVKE